MKSMTGYGFAQKNFDGRVLCVEIKSVNKKHVDIFFKMCRDFLSYEDTLKKNILNKIKRGRVSVHIFFDKEASSEKVEISLNKDLARQSYDLIQELLKDLNLKQEVPIQHYPKFQDFFQNPIANDRKILSVEELSDVLDSALDLFDQARLKEGACLQKDLLQRIFSVQEMFNQIEGRVDLVKNAYREQIEKNVRDLVKDLRFDEGRVLTEVAIFANKIDISEEITRFNIHINNFKDSVENAKDAVGRRFDFLLQELHREINTISSKCSDAKISELAVDIKCELEKIREQVQNIE
ncbi:YicC family protein [PVC group bacterium (ex Bugula neritina AB1)]|nr:YicC family protein [PVC group bacterium (ex Bugula neritina AB1)]